MDAVLLFSLLALYAVFAVLFLVSQPWHPYPGSSIVKAIPALSLALLAWLRVPELAGLFLALGLLFSAAGDVALDRDRGRYFIAGLGFFLVAQLLYTIAFTRAGLDGTGWPLAVLFLVYAVVVGFILWPHLARLRVPVAVYLVAITLMGLAAALRPGSWLVPAGAALFIVSDSAIALDKFVRPIPASRYLIMGTYYAAQLLITLGMIL